MDNFSMQNVKDLEIPEGNVRTIHDYNGKQLWGRVAYDTKYAGDATQGGTPTPDAPQAINVVKGTQTITLTDGVISDSFTVGLTGKNLCDVDSVNNVRWGEPTNSLKNVLNSLSAGTYTFSAVFTLTERNDTTDASKYGVYITNSAGLNILDKPEWGNVGVGTSNYLTEKLTISEAQVGNFTNFYLYGCGIAGATGNASVTEIQIEKSATATPYTPYFTPIELAKIGTYQDYIYKSSGNWYVHKAISKGILNGSEDYWIYQNGAFPAVFTNAMRDINAVLVMSNYFTGQTTRYRDGISDLCCAKVTGANSQIGFRYDAMNGDVPTWRSWLSSHNVTLYYVLATPTDTQITDATLISQLEAIHDWLTRYGYQSSVLGSLPIIISQTNL